MATHKPNHRLPQTHTMRSVGRGMTQLSLVEHALCPLNPSFSLQPHLVHTTSYFFTDQAKRRRKATVRVTCPKGLSAFDELYLWGLLALTFSQAEPSSEFIATPHYCLRQLGLIENKHHRGGKTYRLFREAIERLSVVTYQNDGFYDPLRGEHCRVSFGFFGYRLPLDDGSSRAWRFYWDAQFFHFCQATGSALSFDLETYRELDAASRRLYLLLKKMFWRGKTSFTFDVRHLAVDVLGFSGARKLAQLKLDLMHCMNKLVERGILMLPPGRSIKDSFCKLRKGQFTVTLHRGPNFNQTTPSRAIVDSPYYELLETIGFDRPAVARILRAYPSKLIGEWIDITLAAKERNGEKFFTTSPQAYFIDNIKHAAQGKRTPPDWWRELRRQEEKLRRERRSGDGDELLDRYLETEAREAFENVMQAIFAKLVDAGQGEQEARTQARRIARGNLQRQFYREHPECRPAEPLPISMSSEESAE